MVFSLVTIFPYSSNSFDCLLIVAIFKHRIKEIYTDYTSIHLFYLRQRRSSKPSGYSSKTTRKLDISLPYCYAKSLQQLRMPV